MSLPDRLYLHIPASDRQAEIIAEGRHGWDSLPELWRLMLAHGSPGDIVPPLSGEAGKPSETIDASAQGALERVAAFNAYILGHPLLHRFPTLPVFLDSVHDFLSERLQAWEECGLGKVVLTAQVGRIKFDGDAIEYSQTYTETWERIEAMAQERQYAALDEVIGFANARHSFTQWRAWARIFGLETLADPWFQRLAYGPYWTYYHAAPVVVPFRPAPAALRQREEEPQIPEFLWKLIKGAMRVFGKFPKPSAYKGTGYLPVNSPAWLRDNELTIVYPDANDPDAEQSIDPAAEHYHDGAATHDIPDYDAWFVRRLMPVHENGKVSLRTIKTAGIEYQLGDVSLAAEWDDIAHPRHQSAWARRDGRWSLIELGQQSRVIMANCCDDIVSYDYAGTTCIVRQGALYGLINSHEQRWLTAPQYRQIRCIDHSGTSFWQVQKDGLWGMLDEEGKQIQPCIFDSMEPDIREPFEFKHQGWQVKQEGRAGWIDDAGQWAIGCHWDEVLPCHAPGLYTVRTGASWGLVARGDQQWIACDYLGVEPVAMAAHYGQVNDSRYCMADDMWWPESMDVPEFIAGSDPGRANVFIKVSTASGTGMVDQANRPLLPCTYKDVAVAASGTHPDTRWAIVQAHNTGHGLWSIEQGREIIACQWEWLAMVVSPSLSEPMVWTYGDQQHVLRYLDGRLAFDARLRWIDGDYHEPHKRARPGFAAFATGELTKLWDKGEAVQAMLASDDGQFGELVQLRPGQPVMSEVDSLTEAFTQRGDRAAALSLARRYLSNRDDGQKDIAQARLWAGRACGHEAPPAATLSPLPGAAGKGGDDSDEARRKREDEVQEESARLFADMVYQGAGGPADVRLARRWAEVAAAVHGNNTSSETRIVLAKILLDDSASEADASRACALLEDISAPSLDEGVACYYRAQCLRDGKGVPQDWDLALALFMRADACGLYGPAENIGDMLLEMASTVRMKTATLLMAEATYYYCKYAISEPE